MKAEKLPFTTKSEFEEKSLAMRKRVRLIYEKLGSASLLSHREIIRLLAISLRRSRIRVAFSEGFNPRMKLLPGPALPVGAGGKSEPFDVVLTVSPMTSSEIPERLNPFLPCGLFVTSCFEVSDKTLSFSKTHPYALYRLTMALSETMPAETHAAVEEIMKMLVFNGVKHRFVKMVNNVEILMSIETSGGTNCSCGYIIKSVRGISSDYGRCLNVEIVREEFSLKPFYV